MAWYVVLTSNVNSTTIGNVTAQVQQFANATAYTSTVGASPTSVLPPGWQTSSGFATQAQAQAVADRYNALSPAQRSAGGKPLAPSILPKLPSVNPLNALGIHGDLRHFTLRVVEVLLGAILVIVALEEIMKQTGAPNIVQGVKKYGKMVAK